ncbi:MAG TPA: hypothetical protein VKS81_00730 [Bacteroidota bacterium]|nr:hypothetical protein [Bacteroidota bacterium]
MSKPAKRKIRRSRKPKTMMLVLEKDDPKKEEAFEIEFMLSLTMEQRMKIMENLYNAGMEQLRYHGYKNIPSITARS